MCPIKSWQTGLCLPRMNLAESVQCVWHAINIDITLALCIFSILSLFFLINKNCFVTLYHLQLANCYTAGLFTPTESPSIDWEDNNTAQKFQPWNSSITCKQKSTLSYVEKPVFWLSARSVNILKWKLVSAQHFIAYFMFTRRIRPLLSPKSGSTLNLA